jgi:PST family polysaccharide transporter
LNTSAESIRRIIRTSSITGAASVISICLGLIRTKAAAVLLGPSGVGIIGLLQNLMTTASNVAALGFRTSGTREIAEAAGKGDSLGMAAARRALFWGTVVLSLAGGCAVWLARDFLATRLLHDGSRAADVGWLAVGVVLSVASGSQTALLSGMRRIGDLARIGIMSATMATAIGTCVLAVLRSDGILFFVLVGPSATFLLGLWYSTRLAPIGADATPIRDMFSRWKNFALLGVAFMLSGFAENLGELAVRGIIVEHQGLDGAGHFQAAWTISAMYTSFILSSMGTDYYPRLAGSLEDHAAANRLINEQTQVALLLAGPLLILMLACAPWVIRLLYAAAFHDAASVLRWQLVGDVLKVACWPIGYLMLATGDGKRYLLTTVCMMVVFVAAVAIALPVIGLEASGLGFLLMYATYLPMSYAVARGRIGLRWNASVKVLFTGTLVATATVFAAARWAELAGLSLGIVLACGFGVYSWLQLRSLSTVAGAAERKLRSA